MNKLIKSLVFCFPMLLTACGSDESTTVDSGTHSSSNNGTTTVDNGTHSSSNNGTISISDKTITLNQGERYSGDLNTTETKDFKWSITNQSIHGLATLTPSGRLAYAPKSDFFGTDTITVSVSVTDDVNPVTAIITFEVIQKEKTFISISDKTITLNQGERYSGDLNTTETKDFKWSITNQSIHGLATLTPSGRLAYAPKSDFFGTDTITVSVSVTDDVNPVTAIITFEVIQKEKTFISISDKTITLNQGERYSGDLNTTETKDFKWSITNQSIHGLATLTPSGRLAYAPKSDFFGTDTITVSVTDDVNPVTAIITFEVIQKEKTFISISDKTITLNQGESYTANLNLAGIKNLKWSITNPSIHGTASLTPSGRLTYAPAGYFHGRDEVTVSVTDDVNRDTATFTFVVNQRHNTAPVIEGNTEFSSSGQTINNQIKATDKEGDKLNFSIENTFDKPSYIEFSIDPSGQFTYKNTLNYSKAITLPIVVSDGMSSTKTNITFMTQIADEQSQSDPLYAQQWHLNNTGEDALSSGTPHRDINIGLLHQQGVTGDGVNVAVVDSGLDIGHEDLKDNILTGKSWNFLTKNNDPTSEPDKKGRGDHGTSAAGLIAETGFNGIGGRGVAPSAKLFGLNWTKVQTQKSWIESHGGSRSLDALVINQSYGHYWGELRSSNTIPFRAREALLKSATKKNNDGCGVLLIKAAGNSFKSVYTRDFKFINYSEYAADKSKPELTANNAGVSVNNSSFYNTLISGIQNDPLHPLYPYSSVGAAVFASASVGEVTTDTTGCENGYPSIKENCNYTGSFGGTSGAAPVASGVAALIFGVNTELTWRDVRYIMAKTAKKIDKDFTPITITNEGEDTKFVAEPGWVTNKAGYHFHNWYGFGLLDATAAVQMAANNYTLLPELKETAFVNPNDLSSSTIPEGNSGVKKKVYIVQQMTIEAVQLKVGINHARNSDIAIEVISPSGTHSMIFTPRSLVTETNAKFDNTVLLSHAFFGESSEGNWTIKVTDTNRGDFTYYKVLPQMGGLGDRMFHDEEALNNCTEHGKPDETKCIQKITLSNNIENGALNNVAIRIYGH
ncbi:Ig-like domain-containing protein [Moritella sp. 28]|uniref:S8 family serine peptidase n=1 Tax=Moritella sp. 28 TaxID=2746232 RepID=UPI001BA47E96|nr:Ig-like domain-containing protein [Moritella sp. 28]QUM83138.1 S8 family serine peptidase [Moritella sp. 28]